MHIGSRPGSFSFDNGDGSEMSLLNWIPRCFELCRVYSNSAKVWNEEEFPGVLEREIEGKIRLDLFTSSIKYEI